MSLNPTLLARSFQLGAGGFINRPNVKMFAGVIRPDGNSSGGGTITWSFLLTNTNHNKVGTFKVEASGSNLRLRFPRCRNVISVSITPDETLSANGVMCGASVGQETADISFYQSWGVYGGLLTGSGSTFTKAGDLSSFTFGTLNANQIYFRPPKPFQGTGTDAQNDVYWKSSIARFCGSNDRTLVRITGGLGSDYFGYQLLDDTGTPVVTNDSNDKIEIITNTPKRVSINANSNNGFGHPGANVFTTASNIWVVLILEY